MIILDASTISPRTNGETQDGMFESSGDDDDEDGTSDTDEDSR